MNRLVPIALVAVPAAMAETYDVVADFDASNIPGVTPYTCGSGNDPFGFTLMLTITPDCADNNTERLNNCAGFPHASRISCNGADVTYQTIVQPPDMARMEPQESFGTMVRFTAPNRLRSRQRERSIFSLHRPGRYDQQRSRAGERGPVGRRPSAPVDLPAVAA